MVFVELKGGLGNQLFQYAAARSISLTCKQELFISRERLRYDWQRREYVSGIINYPLRYERNIRRYWPNSVRLTESNYDLFLTSRDIPHIVLEGYWQAERYFLENSEIIKGDLDVKKNAKGNSSRLKNIINTNSVAIHVRRGDYTNQKSTESTFGGICTIDYYLKAINYLKEIIVNPEFYVFSDDPEWCKKTFTKKLFNARINIIDSGHRAISSRFDNNYLIRNFLGLFKNLIPDKTLMDFTLMANCKHFIIANSTFSWWAAWLAGNEDKIICAPSRWDREGLRDDIIPENWLKIAV